MASTKGIKAGVLMREELTEPEGAVWMPSRLARLWSYLLACQRLPIRQRADLGGEDRQIRAQLLYELLTANSGKDLRPRALKVVGARITGTLDLGRFESDLGLYFAGQRVDVVLLPMVLLASLISP